MSISKTKEAYSTPENAEGCKKGTFFIEDEKNTEEANCMSKEEVTLKLKMQHPVKH